MFDPSSPPHGPHANGMICFINNLKHITQQMGQMSVQTSEPTSSEDMQKHANPSLTSEILTVQSMDLRGKKMKDKGKHSVNPSQNPEKLIVQSMELRGNKKKYKSKKNANFGKGDALNPTQDSGKQQYIVLMQHFLQHHHQMVATTLEPPLRGNQSKSPQEGNDPNANVFMCDHEVNIKMRSHSYDVSPYTLDESESQ